MLLLDILKGDSRKQESLVVKSCTEREEISNESLQVKVSVEMGNKANKEPQLQPRTEGAKISNDSSQVKTPVGMGNKENKKPKTLKIVAKVPRDARGRKRRQSLSALDFNTENQQMPVTNDVEPAISVGISCEEGLLIDLSAPQEENQSPMMKQNLQNILKDLDGIGFSIEKTPRPVPRLLKISRKVPEDNLKKTAGTAAKIVLRRAEQSLGDILEDFESLHCTDSD